MSEFILNTAIRRYFKEISDIPRGSGNEKGIADYLVAFGKAHNLETEVHPVNNVVIKKPASSGYEDHDAVMLQGHIDIVCEKEDGCTHNFETDPLQLYVDDQNWLHATGTTLGADDGMAVAYMLAILEDNSLKHPALECVFTRSEEIGLIGAAEIDCTNMKSRKLINLDGGGENGTCVSSSGGRRVTVSRSIMLSENEWPCYRVRISECLGGHSGVCIDKERSSAIKLVFRVLRNLSRTGAKIRLLEGFGGAKENAIARACEVTFASDSKEVKEVVESTFADIKDEVALTEPEIQFCFEEIPMVKDASCPNCSKAVIEMVDLMPQGLMHKDLKLNIPIVSLNHGIFSYKNGEFKLYVSIRSPFASYRTQLSNQLSDIAALFGAEVEISNDYGGWSYNPVSPLREILRSVLKNHGKDMFEESTHGGLETGIFAEKIPGLDIITYGPIATGAHTPQEKLNLDSFDRSYGILVELLENC